MEEIHIKSADLDVADHPLSSDVVSTSATYISHYPITPKGSLQKIYRRGDRIYHMQDENITMIKDGATETKTSIAEDEDRSLDEVASGESLFKTFTFDKSIGKEETEKCIAFWRSVVEKNLEPIKCSLIESTSQQKTKHEGKRKAKDDKALSKTSTKFPGGRVPKDSVMVKKRTNVWYDIVAELQKKRLNDTKLMMEKRCRFCGYVNSPPYEVEDPEKQTKDIIDELSKWKPRSFKHKRGTVDSTRRSERFSLDTEKSMLSSNRQSASQGGAEGPETIMEETKDNRLDDSVLQSIKEEASKIKHINAIEEKKKQGAYSKWRQNQIEPCECKRLGCDCNTNPAIKAVIDQPSKIRSMSSVQYIKMAESKGSKFEFQPAYKTSDPKVEMALNSGQQMLDSQEPSLLASKETVEPEVDPTKIEQTPLKPSEMEEKPLGSIPDAAPERETKSDAATNGDTITDDSTSFGPARNDEIKSNENSSISSGSSKLKKILVSNDNGTNGTTSERSRSRTKKSLSVVLNCMCSNSRCDCFGLIKLPERSLPKVESDIPKPPKPRHSSLRRVNSLELIKKRISISSNLMEGRPLPPRMSLRQEDRVASDRRRSRVKSVDSLEIIRRRISQESKRSNYSDESVKSDDLNHPRRRTVSIVL